MGIHRSNRPAIAGVLLMASLANAERGSQRPPLGPLVVCPENPRYFQNSQTGDVVYLTGSHTWANLVDFGPSDPPTPFDYQAYIDWMAGLNHNFMRLWTWELVSWDTKANGEGKHHTAAPHPYARTGPGTALDGKPKFDLTKYEPAYFQRLRDRVAAARERGIYVSVMLFEGWGLQAVRDLQRESPGLDAVAVPDDPLHQGV